MRSTYAGINLSNLKKNYINIKRKVKDVKIMAVVKADAYGHGMKEVVYALNSLNDKKPDYYAAAITDEAVELRKLKIKQPILIFEPIIKNEIDLIFNYNLTATVFEDSHVKIISQALNKFNKKNKSRRKVKVHVKVDTGMNRLGINFTEALNFILMLSKNKNFIIDGIYTHFATSDEKDKKFANLQLKRFKLLLDELNKSGINYGLAHAANSGAILDMPEAYFDMVRPGISLYGYYPSLETSESIDLKPVMSLVSYAASIKEIQKGDTVSYGRIFTANKKINIVSVPIGYADGFSRNLSNKTFAIINGKLYPQVGRVTMDRIMFNVNNDKIKPGEKVILLGKHANINIDAWDWSKQLNTIPYEITCNISKRIPRVYNY